jgi:transposase InsO family protein
MHHGLEAHLTADIPANALADAALNAKWLQDDRRVRGDMMLAVSPLQRGFIRDRTTARAAWAKLIEVYEPKLAFNILHLKKELYQCRLEETSAKDAMQAHIGRMADLIARLASVGVMVTEQDAGVQLYLSLPDTYSQIAAAFSLRPMEEVTFDKVSSILLQEERRLRDLTTPSPSATAKAESALVAAHSSQSSSNSRQRSNNRNRPDRPTCGYCSKTGHTEAECYQKHGYPVGHPRRSGQHAQPRYNAADNNGPYAFFAHGFHCAVVDDTAPVGPFTPLTLTAPASVALMTQQPSDLSSRPTACEWLIDSGASQHLCRTREWFASYEPITGKSVVVANGVLIPAIGRGDIHVLISLGGRVEPGVFRNVLHVPGMDYNLLSVGKMTEAGLHLSFHGEDCLVRSNSGHVIARATRTTVPGTRTASLYALSVRPLHGQLALNAVRGPPSTMELLASVARAHSVMAPAEPALGPAAIDSRLLAHLRMGHLHLQALPKLRTLAADTAWIGDAGHGQPFHCEACVMGKAHRAPTPQAAAFRAQEPLELVHSDVCGPVRSTSLSGARYFVLFVDDCTRFMVAYPIAKKSDVFDRFLTYKAWAETMTGRRLRSLRTDGGGEYASNAFDQHLRTCGVSRQRTPPYTPQHNGVAERANRTLMEMARCLLYQAALPGQFWAFALITAVYLRNRSPTSSLDNQTPIEAWTGRQPSLGHLRVFGCLAYAHVPDLKRGKLDVKARACVLVGYSAESKAYLLYDPDGRSVITSKDVTFVEAQPGILVHADRQQPGVATVPFDIVGDGGQHAAPVPLHVQQAASDLANDEKGDVPDDHNVASAGLDPAAAPGTGPAFVPAHAPLAPTFLQSVRRAMQARQAAASLSRVPSSDRSRADSTVRSPSAPPAPRRSNRDHASSRALDANPASSLVVNSPGSQQPDGVPTAPVVSSLPTYALHVQPSASESDPATFQEAMHRSDRLQWEQAAREEFDSIQAAGTWTLGKLPPGRKAIGCKWVFKLKRKADGSVDRYKARLVAKGYAQKEGIDYQETFAPVAKFSAIRALLSMAAHYDLEVHQMDVHSAFLNGDLDHDIYMEQPEGFTAPGHEHLVCKLQKSIYGELPQLDMQL